MGCVIEQSKGMSFVIAGGGGDGGDVGDVGR